MAVATLKSHTVGHKKVELAQTSGKKYIVYLSHFDGLIWVQTNLCDSKNGGGYLDMLTAKALYETTKSAIDEFYGGNSR